MSKVSYTIAVFLLSSLTSVYAAVVPVGVQEDISLTTVTDTWGWDLQYRGDYNLNLSIDTMFGGHGDLIMLGAIKDGSDTIELLAATTWSDFWTYTAKNTTNESNGAEWYNNGGSLGFAGLGDSINQSSADTSSVNANLRLSWHTESNYDQIAQSIQYGWRAGETTGLNSSTNWDRIVFTANSADLIATPIPAAAFMFAPALLGFMGLRRKAKNSVA